MKEVIKIIKKNEAHLRIAADPSVLQEISDYFTFEIPSAKFHPLYRNKVWDGKLRLMSMITKELPVGLLSYLEHFCEVNNYTIDYEEYFQEADAVTIDQVREFCQNLDLSLPQGQAIRDYQIEAVYQAISGGRKLLISPTSCMDPETEIEVELETSYKTKITLSQLEKLTAAGYSAKINTPTGFEQITDTYRKHSEGVKLHLSNGATIRCARDHLISVNGSWTKAKQLVVGEAIGNVGVVSIEPLPSQDWIDFSIDAEHESYYHEGLLHHNSGKSLVLYCLVRWNEQFNRQQLIIVPTTSLCLQMKSDFKSYSQSNGWDSDQVRVIMGGEEKNKTSAVTVSTWQSLYDLPKKFFVDFNVVYGDECHLFQSKSLTGIMNKCVNAPYRVGVTGTLDGSKANKLVIEGVFGPAYKVISTKELMDSKQIAELEIFAIILEYNDQIKKANKDLKYQEEMDFLVQHLPRNKFIRNLTLSQKGNTLVLFQYVEKHGKILFDMINDKDSARQVFFVYGGTDAEQRENIRQITEGENDAIIIGSYGCMSTGVNIRNLHNIIFASPSKSRIRNLQSIGRGLRKGDEKDECKLYDIGDDMTWKTRRNYTLNHMVERIKIYNDEQFTYRTVKVPI